MSVLATPVGAIRIPRSMMLRDTASLAVTAALIAGAIWLNPSTLPLFAVGFIVFLPLERFLPRRNIAASAQQTLIGLAHLTVSTTLSMALMTLALMSVALLPTLAITAHWIASLPAPASLGIVVLIGDAGYYWAHRAAHGLPILWRFHRIHHAAEELDWMAAARVHPVDQLVLHLGWIIPLKLLGVASPWFAAYAVFLTVLPLLAHSNIKASFGPLQWLIVTPDFHHWHHTAEADAINHNFAGQLPVVDLIFGTWWFPSGRRVMRYGIDGAVAENYLGQLSEPVMEAAKLVVGAR